jgi:hypothetical protein
MPEPNIEKYIEGQHSLTPEEREKAEKEGKLQEMEEKMRNATKAKREKQAEKAIDGLEKEIKKEQI